MRDTEQISSSLGSMAQLSNYERYVGTVRTYLQSYRPGLI